MLCFASFGVKGVKQKAKIKDLNVYPQNGGTWGNETDDWKDLFKMFNVKGVF